MSRLRSGQWLAVTAGGLVFAALVGIAVCLIALHRLSDARRQVVERLDPASVASARYLTALVDEETGLRGFELAGQETFLAPYVTGSRDAAAAHKHLQQIAATGDAPGLAEDLRNVGVASSSWHLLYADPVILTVRAKRAHHPARDLPSLRSGKAQFDQVRAAFRQLDDNLAARRAVVRTDLRHAANAATWAVLFTAALLLLAAIVAGATLRRTVATPLSRLARDARRIARGDFDHPVAIVGPRDIQGLSTDIESMRRRIIAELEIVNRSRAQLEEQTVDLQRSNAELEQFAYVASHDLQEPLRKVASFTQLLQQRYGGELDERADQYIGFAVDGARRMQNLINDLLAFSRVGRMEQPHGDVDCAELLERVRGDLAGSIEESDAVIEAGPLPTVSGDASLVRLVFQNLIGNAIKFRGDAAPVVRLSAEPDGEFWRFRCADNGIGIDAEYADRIFVIFQRLHPRSSYEGTGIGLAMCRKIVEYHGGRMWLDTEYTGGSAFCFTLRA
ncbi:sensor histidine kinase [Baekduia sp.]|uniref:sensor histidine kinase n=1 Tax=Baekduia sp. TaxID=2600305 RepID=UPI002E0A1814|nr:ATP-binding protein [Baekduia sp.]